MNRLLRLGCVVLLAAACSSGADTSASPGGSIDLSAFAEAWSSGDADAVRSFYTSDARIFPIGVDEAGSDELTSEGWGLGEDIERELAEHSGTYQVFDPVRVGDIATYTWRWTLQSFTITGADILHYRDDLIWRQFID